MTAEIHLPFPISVNALYRPFGNRMIKSKPYRAWVTNATKFVEYNRKGKPLPKIEGAFRYKVVLSAAERTRSKDGDNYSSKAILDLLQEIGVIKNDNMAEGGSWEWGVAPHGCRVELEAA